MTEPNGNGTRLIMVSDNGVCLSVSEAGFSSWRYHVGIKPQDEQCASASCREPHASPPCFRYFEDERKDGKRPLCGNILTCVEQGQRQWLVRGCNVVRGS